MDLNSRSRWMGITSFVLSLVALISLQIPFSNSVINMFYAIIIINLLGLIFGLIAIYKDKGSKKLALTGVIICLVVFFEFSLGYISLLKSVQLEQTLQSLFNIPL